jgi:hypothetical protein
MIFYIFTVFTISQEAVFTSMYKWGEGEPEGIRGWDLMRAHVPGLRRRRNFRQM